MAGTIRTILNTCNPPEGVKLGFIAKWLVITRSCVISMTAFSALIGVVLAWRDGYFSWTKSLLIFAGLLLAHMANNIINDLMDYRSGVDTPDYHRVQYSPHPIHAKLASQAQLIAAFLLISLIDLAIMVRLVQLRDWGVAVFAVIGFLLSVTYVGGRRSLKFNGLGELAVFLVWGPLMIGGTYYTLAGGLAPDTFLAAAPYGLLVTTVLIGKHIDKHDADKAKGVRTLPVILGPARAIVLIKWLIVLFYATTALCSTFNFLPQGSLLVFFSLGRAAEVWKTLSAPRPTEAPANWPVWPLWYVGWCFHLVKLAGALLMLGMFIQVGLTRLLQ